MASSGPGASKAAACGSAGEAPPGSPQLASLTARPCSQLQMDSRTQAPRLLHPSPFWRHAKRCWPPSWLQRMPRAMKPARMRLQKRTQQLLGAIPQQRRRPASQRHRPLLLHMSDGTRGETMPRTCLSQGITDLGIKDCPGSTATAHRAVAPGCAANTSGCRLGAWSIAISSGKQDSRLHNVRKFSARHEAQHFPHTPQSTGSTSKHSSRLHNVMLHMIALVCGADIGLCCIPHGCLEPEHNQQSVQSFL